MLHSGHVIPMLSSLLSLLPSLPPIFSHIPLINQRSDQIFSPEGPLNPTGRIVNQTLRPLYFFLSPN